MIPGGQYLLMKYTPSVTTFLLPALISSFCLFGLFYYVISKVDSESFFFWYSNVTDDTKDRVSLLFRASSNGTWTYLVTNVLNGE